jgi:hypothetical protein
VIQKATSAPSIHNSQPWRWRYDDDGLHLFADATRLLQVADPDGRQLLVSCGAALGFARLALRARGFDTTVTLGAELNGATPPADGTELAVLSLAGQRPAHAAELDLVAAMAARHTDRRPFLPGPLDQADVVALRHAAESEAGWLLVFEDPDRRIDAAVLLAHADWIESQDPAYVAELKSWSRTDPGATDGIPRASVVTAERVRESEFVVRDFDVVGEAGTRLDDIVDDVVVERPTVVALGTDSDQPADRLLAGTALGRVLLTATARGAAASPLGQVVDVSSARSLLSEAAGGVGHVQMVLRVGYPDPATGPLPATPRRPVDEVLEIA